MQQFTGLEYLKMDIASNFGLDKALWCERLDWFETNKNNLEALMNKAETPALFYAGVTAYKDVLQNKPIGYPISLDASASGLQLLSVLTCDSNAAKLCNVINTGNREDAYTVIYQAMLKALGTTGNISREMTKDAILTALYGSEAVPKRVFGTGNLLRMFNQTMDEKAPGCWELNKAFLSLWDKTKDTYSWVMPDNFHVQIKVMVPVSKRIHFMDKPYDVVYKEHGTTEQGRSLSANSVHSLDGMVVREISRRCMYNPTRINNIRNLLNQTNKLEHDESTEMVLTLWDRYKASGYLSARILDYLTARNIGNVDYAVIKELVDSLPKKPFNILTIHDCFRCLPKYGNDLRQQYMLQLFYIAKSNMLEYLLEQIVGKKIQIDKLDPNMHKDVLTAEYAIS